MKRLVKVGLVSWGMLSLPAAVAAQDTMGRRASLFDLGIYAGGAYHTDWFTTPDNVGGDEGWGPGFAPAFGATATYWASPSFGVRLHGTYMPSNFAPEGFNEDKVNTWLIDLDLATRSFGGDSMFIPIRRNSFASAGITYVRATPDGGEASDGFGANVKFGINFAPLGPTLTPFTELHLWGYQIPFDNVDKDFAVGAGLMFGINAYLR